MRVAPLVLLASGVAWLGALPGLTRLELESNEQTARNTLKSIHRAQGELVRDTGRPGGFEDLSPAYLAGHFSLSAGSNAGLAEKGGYWFRIDRCGDRWTAYAWPVEFGSTGRCVLAIDGAGSIREAPNRRAYSGLARAPAPDAAYVGGRLADRRGETTSDGDRWAHG